MMNYEDKVQQIKRIKFEVLEEINSKFPGAYAEAMNYSLHIDDANRRRGRKYAKNAALGYCSFTNREIVLDINHVKLCTMEQIEDTIRHEYAHVVAGSIYGDRGHGRAWKYVASQLGANSEATSNVTDEYKEHRNSKMKYVLVVWDDDGNHEVVGYFGRKLKNIKNRYLAGRYDTMGKLKMLDNKLFRQGIVQVLHS